MRASADWRPLARAPRVEEPEWTGLIAFHELALTGRPPKRYLRDMIDTSLGENSVGRPSRAEAADYYFTYIDQVPAGDICDTLNQQLDSTRALYRAITPAESRFSYAPGKWTIADTLSHISDAERVFAFRAWWFARGVDAPLPGFDQNVVAEAAHNAARPWSSYLDEFCAVRMATLALFHSLPPAAWMRSGSASGNTFSVRALACIIAGHLAHHNRLVRERYLTLPPGATTSR